jgi:hypothetical protein
MPPAARGDVTFRVAKIEFPGFNSDTSITDGFL